MIRCNLAVVLAEQGLKISRVSADTKISRTTLTSLANNYSQGIQFDTLDVLCRYLNVNPEQLISYVPIAFSSFNVQIPENIIEKKDEKICCFNLYINFMLTERSKQTVCMLHSLLSIVQYAGVITEIETRILRDEEHSSEDDVVEESIKSLKRAFALMPRAFINSLRDQIINEILIILSQYYKISEDVSTPFYWPDILLD